MTTKKLLVLGATGATGQLVVHQALDAGHHVTALVRSPDKVTTTHPNLTVLGGQPTDPSDVRKAIEGVDAVISTLGAPKGTLMTDTTRALLSATDAGDATPIVMMSSFAIRRDQLTRPARAITGMAMGAAIKDRSTAEDLLRRSGRPYAIAHAARLTDGPLTGSVTVVADGARVSMSDAISRADVAAWLLRASTQEAAGGHDDVVITG